MLSPEETRGLEPSLAPVFRHAVLTPDAASVSNPGAVAKAYAELFTKLGGVILKGDALTLHRSGEAWRVDTDEGPVDGKQAVIALGPWAPDVLGPLGIHLPLKWKRGYHRHFKSRGNAGLTRPVVDADYGYCLAPMEQGIRLTTGAEFADRDARTDAGPVRPAVAGGPRALSAGRGRRGAALDGLAAVLCRFTAGDRARAGPAGALARLRPRALGPDAWPRDRPAAGGNDDRSDAVLRSQAVFRGAVRVLSGAALTIFW